MIYPNEPIYVIDGLPPRKDLSLNAYNFSIGLKPDVAIKAYNTIVSDDFVEKMNKWGKDLIKHLFNQSDYIKNPYHFAENREREKTLILHWCTVPGNACGIGIDKDVYNSIKELEFNERLLEYNSNNIDSIIQAYSLECLWLHWANAAFAKTRDD